MLWKTDSDTEVPVLAISGPPPSGPLALPQQAVTQLQTFSVSLLPAASHSLLLCGLTSSFTGENEPIRPGAGGSGGSSNPNLPSPTHPSFFLDTRREAASHPHLRTPAPLPAQSTHPRCPAPHRLISSLQPPKGEDPNTLWEQPDRAGPKVTVWDSSISQGTLLEVALSVVLTEAGLITALTKLQ